MKLHATIAIAMTCFVAATYAQTLRDPTAPPVSARTGQASTRVAPSAVPPASVTAIRVGPGQSMAIVGGRKVKVGDVLAEGTVQSIRGHEVVLSTAEGRRVLKLYPAVNKQTHVSVANRDVAKGNPAPVAPSTGDSTQ